MGIKYAMLLSITITLLLSLLLIPSLLNSSNKLHPINHSDHHLLQQKPYPVSFAYLISAAKGDVDRLIRLLTAIYHPANCYLLHLDRDAEPEEQHHLYQSISSHPTFTRFGNVWIVQKSNLVTYRGPTMLTTTLHAMSILLRTCHWDWFINLSASDYPLVTQDDLIVAFSSLPRDLNFIQHTSRLGWKIKKRAKPAMMDPALYETNKTEIIWLPQNRSIPTAFKLFTGSAWTVLSRSFAEYSIIGWDNLPRTLLLYYANFVSSPEGYFQTLICNSGEYRNTTVNHDLRYITWDNPPKQHPLNLGIKDYRKAVLSSRVFARKFKKDDPVLYKIDRELLRRKGLQFTLGGWCYDDDKKMCTDSPSEGAAGVLKPGAGSRRLRSLLTKLLSAKFFNKRQCR
ncbi:core-2/I-branching beta-1,6-N-acetylglucosaminyltransferase family protein [Carex rostrata]